MSLRLLALALACASILPASRVLAQDPAEKADAEKAEIASPEKSDSGQGGDRAKSPRKPKLEYATFGGGCFWCVEAVMEKIPGVRAAVSGYSGGFVANPSYQMVCTGQTGHAEVVQVEYDPSIVSYEKLLAVFFTTHDPTTPNMQGDDVGSQYRSIILYHDDSQKEAALKYYKDLTAKKAFRYPIVTELVPLVAFWPAEAYHQDYYKNHRGDMYCSIYIDPKLKKLRAKHLTSPGPGAPTGNKTH